MIFKKEEAIKYGIEFVNSLPFLERGKYNINDETHMLFLGSYEIKKKIIHLNELANNYNKFIAHKNGLKNYKIWTYDGEEKDIYKKLLKTDKFEITLPIEHLLNAGIKMKDIVKVTALKNHKKGKHPTKSLDNEDEDMEMGMFDDE